MSMQHNRRLSKTEIDFQNTFGRDNLVRNRKPLIMDLVSMDNGGFSILNADIGYKKFFVYLVSKIQNGELDLAYVTNTPKDKYVPLWFDLDKCQVHSLVALKYIISFLADLYKKPLVEIVQSTCMLSSLLKKQNHHIFVGCFLMNYEGRKSITKMICNTKKELGIDNKATQIRLPGPRKWCRDQKKFIINSNYTFVFPSISDGMSFEIFYNKINLLHYYKKKYYKAIRLLKGDNSYVNTFMNTNLCRMRVNALVEPDNTEIISDSHLRLISTGVHVNPRDLYRNDDNNTNNNNTMVVNDNNDNSNNLNDTHNIRGRGINDDDIIQNDIELANAPILSQLLETEENVQAVQNSINTNGLIINESDDGDNNKENVESGVSIQTINRNNNNRNVERNTTIVNISGDNSDSISDAERHTGILAIFDDNRDNDNNDNNNNNNNNNNDNNGLGNESLNDLHLLLGDIQNTQSELEDNESKIMELDDENSPVNSVDIDDNIRDQIRGQYPFLASILLQYPIKVIKKYSKSVVFGFDKSTRGRNCPFRNKIHSRNNGYICYNKRNGLVVLKCHSGDCKNQSKVIWKRQQAASKLISATDYDLVREFLSTYDDVVYSDSDIDGFYFRGEFCWERDISNIKLIGRIQGDFANKISELYNSKIDECDEEEKIKELVIEKKKCESLLKMRYKLSGIIDTLKVYLNKEIRWNSNPYLTVFPNGVLNSKTGVFGKTLPEDYINNNRSMKCPWGPIDPEFIKNELLIGLFDKLFPSKEIRDFYLSYISLILDSVNSKKCLINHGQRGNNAKTTINNFIVWAAGDYGSIGDPKILLKGKKDRGIIANLHQKRITALEEPDDTKAMDGSFLKLLLSGAQYLCVRGLYSTKTRIELCLKLVLSCNSLPAFLADSAVLARLVYIPWVALFTSDPDKVNPLERIYLINPKYSDENWWTVAAPQLYHLLFQYYSKIRDNNGILETPKILVEATTHFIYDNDPFMRWFNANFELLEQNSGNEREFVTLSEIVMKLDAAADKSQIIGSRFITTKRYVGKQINAKSELLDRKHNKYTNFRVSLTERRRYRGITSQTCQQCQYAGYVIRYCRMKAAESFEAWSWDSYQDNRAKSPASIEREQHIIRQQRLAVIAKKIVNGDNDIDSDALNEFQTILDTLNSNNNNNNNNTGRKGKRKRKGNSNNNNNNNNNNMDNDNNDSTDEYDENDDFRSPPRPLSKKRKLNN